MTKIFIFQKEEVEDLLKNKLSNLENRNKIDHITNTDISVQPPVKIKI